jgi:predicted dehydrogenase
VEDCKVVAVCDENGAAASKAASARGADAHVDWRSLLDASGLSAVDICVPPIGHSPIALGALARGIPVLCEKPLARNAVEAREIATAADRAGVPFMTAFCHRFHPPVAFARELIENDDLGKPVMFRNRFSGYFAGVEEKWFSDPEVAGGGALPDTAVHSIDLFRFLMGEVAEACGFAATFRPALAVEDSAALCLRAESGAIGVIEASWATPGGRNVLEVYGTAGACTVDYDTGDCRYKTADMAVWQGKSFGGPDRFQLEIDHFAAVLRGEAKLSVTHLDGLRATEIAESVAPKR